MTIHQHAGKPARPEDCINLGRLVSDYFLLAPDVNRQEHRVTFGTSGHRGSSFKNSFNEQHILAICQAIAEYRNSMNYQGPLYLGKDTHMLSEPAFANAIQVFIANDIQVIVQDDDGFTPTPVISRLIIKHNEMSDKMSDGVIITPSHNPPEDGGIKYNPAHGGPAEEVITKAIENRANEIIVNLCREVQQLSLADAIESPLLKKQDFIGFYTEQLSEVIDMEVISKAGIKIGVDPLGGSGIHYWPVIAKKYDLNIEVVNQIVDGSFSFMPLDKDGKIRMDCSSPYAMNNLIMLKGKYDIAIGNDPDFDRHGIVTKTGGLINPNHYLAVAIHYLMTHRTWSESCQIGKTLVSSSLIDRVAKLIKRPLSEVPVGFKWFVDGLHTGEYAFGGEESAGATFLTKEGKCWTTDKDGFVMGLLAAEILAIKQKDPYQYYLDLVSAVGEPYYGRVEAVANRRQKEVLSSISANDIQDDFLAGEPIQKVLTHASGNNAAIGGVKVITENGWFAARPSGTEDIYKIYAESFINQEHLQVIIKEAQQIVTAAFTRAIKDKHE